MDSNSNGTREHGSALPLLPLTPATFLLLGNTQFSQFHVCSSGDFFFSMSK